MADEERPTAGDGFDDWLDEEAGPDTDPYASLSDDDPEGEIADWLAFTEGSDTETEATGETAVEADDGASLLGDTAEGAVHAAPDDVTAEISMPETGTDDAVEEGIEPDGAPDDAQGRTADPSVDDDLDAVVRMPAVVLPDPEDDATGEIPATAAAGDAADHRPATTVDLDDFDGGGRADTEEVPIIAAAEVAPVDEPEPDVGTDDAVHDDAPTADPGPDGPPDAIDGDGDTDASDEVPEDTGELPLVDGLDEDDTGELPIADSSQPDDTDEIPLVDEVRADADDHQPEAAIVAGDFAASPGGEVFDLETADDDPADRIGLSRDDYLQTATREHEGLAAAIAEAETEETEQVALAAPIPGLESTVVGFEDVVEAEGHTRVRARASGDLVARVITGVVLIAALGASMVWRPALVALATVVFVLGAGEFYTALRRTGRAPISLFGFVGILGAAIGSFFWGAVAIPVSFFLVTTLLLLFYAVVPGKVDPMANLALTVIVMVWAGLGTYAMTIIESEDYRPLVIGVVITVALMDIAQYFIGRALGRHQLAPWVSPKKTIEGLVGGVIVALALGASLHFVPPFELTSGLAIGAAIAVLSPMGDLAMSAAKRSLGIKDMGSILPGHGGFMDRIDGLLFVIPAAWAIFLWAGLI